MNGYPVGTKVHVRRGNMSFQGVILGLTTEKRKRKTRRDFWDMVEVVASYQVALIVTGLAGDTTMKATVPPGAVTRRYS